MSQFVPGDPRINRKGREKGSKDKKWQSLQPLWDALMKEMPHLRPRERARIYAEMVKLHFERAVGKLPKTPEESVNNVSQMLEELKKAETQVNADKAGSDTPSLDNRPPTL